MEVVYADPGKKLVFSGALGALQSIAATGSMTIQFAAAGDGTKLTDVYKRQVLKLKGTKYGCGIGQCGACTVHLNGKAVRSCQTPVSAAAQAPITTLEGLSADGTHPVQVAWLEIDVPQCGYCQAGQMMSAAALLAKTPKPTDQDINSATVSYTHLDVYKRQGADTLGNDDVFHCHWHAG